MSRTMKKETLLLIRELLDLRWEFLRRNEEYRSDHSAYRALVARHGSEEAPPVRREAFRLMGKYRLGALPDPAEDADGIRLPIMYPFGDRPEVSGFPALRIFDPDGREEEGDRVGGGKFRVTIDVDLRTPRSHVIPVLDAILEDLQLRRMDRHPDFHPEQDAEPPEDLGIYEWYLQIWDRRRAGESAEEIARDLYPRAFEKPSRRFGGGTATERVEAGLREAERLIRESALVEEAGIPSPAPPPAPPSTPPSPPLDGNTPSA
ncbi:MAG: transcriptional regulator domain-containing protein [Nitrospinota bacterium]